VRSANTVQLRSNEFLGLKESLQLPDACGVAHFSQRFRLNLANTLTSHLELLSNLLQGPGIAIAQAESEFQHFSFAFGQAG
jgi:hypothetical protein